MKSSWMASIASVALALAGVVSTAGAQTVPFTYLQPASFEVMVPLLPRAGAYYSTASSGSGLLLDVSPSGLVFGAFFYTREDGQRDWLTVAGRHEPASLAQWMATGETGHLATLRLETSNGPAGFNQTGPAGVTVAVGDEPVVLTWYGPDRVKVQFDGTEQMLGALLAIDPAVPTDDKIIGTWRASVIRSSGWRNTTTGAQVLPRVHEIAVGQIEISAEPMPVTYAAADGAPPMALPAVGTKHYVARGVGALFEQPQPSDSTSVVTSRHALSQRVDQLTGTSWKEVVAWLGSTGTSTPHDTRGKRIHYDSATRQHRFVGPGTVSDTRSEGNGVLVTVRPQSPTTSFYFVNPDRVIVREVRRTFDGALMFYQETVLDRVTPAIEQQQAVGCARTAWASTTGSSGVLRCGQNGQWP